MLDKVELMEIIHEIFKDSYEQILFYDKNGK